MRKNLLGIMLVFVSGYSIATSIDMNVVNSIASNLDHDIIDIKKNVKHIDPSLVDLSVNQYIIRVRQRIEMLNDPILIKENQIALCVVEKNNHIKSEKFCSTISQ